MTTVTVKPKITWEKLPDDFPLPDDPGDNKEPRETVRGIGCGGGMNLGNFYLGE